MPEQKTVRVRIAVAAFPDGRWFAFGDDKADEEIVRQVFEHACVGKPQHWIEADVPIPQPQTIEGAVVP